MRLPPAPLRRSGCGEPSGTAVAAARQGDRCLLPDQPLCTPHETLRTCAAPAGPRWPCTPRVLRSCSLGALASGTPGPGQSSQLSSAWPRGRPQQLCKGQACSSLTVPRHLQSPLHARWSLGAQLLTQQASPPAPAPPPLLRELS